MSTKFQKKRNLINLIGIRSLNIQIGRYFCEIIGSKCPICLENITFSPFKGELLIGCGQCNCWGHYECVKNLENCPVCRYKK